MDGGSTVKPMPVLYLDLDGTIRKGVSELGYRVSKPEEVEVFDEVVDLLIRYKQKGWIIACTSNQGQIALEETTEQEVIRCMVKTMELCRHLIDVLVFCRHHPQAENAEERNCLCRKPRYGQLVTAQFRLLDRYPQGTFPLSLSLMVSNQEEDKLLAEYLGISFMTGIDWRSSGLIKSAKAN
jgi:D-glycero-D-manno-heptose 1,7-bisphosphate phosphatase